MLSVDAVARQKIVSMHFDKTHRNLPSAEGFDKSYRPPAEGAIEEIFNTYNGVLKPIKLPENMLLKNKVVINYARIMCN